MLLLFSLLMLLLIWDKTCDLFGFYVMSKLPDAGPRPSRRSQQCPCWQRWWGFHYSFSWNFWRWNSAEGPPRDTNQHNETKHGHIRVKRVGELIKFNTESSVPTSLLDLSVLLLGRRRTSLKSSLMSFSIRGIVETRFKRKAEQMNHDVWAREPGLAK